MDDYRQFIVSFDSPDAPTDPQHWSRWKKILTLFLYCLSVFVVVFASAVSSPGTDAMLRDFRDNERTAWGGWATFMCGLSLGPVVWPHLSEVYGRKKSTLVPFFLSTLSALGTALSMNLPFFLVTRFLCGLFGCAVVTNTALVAGDVYGEKEAMWPIWAYILAAVLAEPLAEPMVNHVLDSGYHWRTPLYLNALLMIAISILDHILIDESYTPLLLQRLSQHLQTETGSSRYHVHHDVDASVRNLKGVIYTFLEIPVRILLTPICFLVCLHAAFAYALFTGCVFTMPTVLQQHTPSSLIDAITLVALLIGIGFGMYLENLSYQYYVASFHRTGRWTPEARLPGMMAGSICLAVGLFVFAQTLHLALFWPLLGAAMVGCGFWLLFMSTPNYLLKCYTIGSSSTSAATTLSRTLFAPFFVAVSAMTIQFMDDQMNLNTLVVIAWLLAPIPFVLWFWGETIRSVEWWTEGDSDEEWVTEEEWYDNDHED